VSQQDVNLPRVQIQVEIRTTVWTSIDLQLQLVQATDTTLLPQLQSQGLNVSDVVLSSIVLVQVRSPCIPLHRRRYIVCS
jgi:hypothetical protein